MKPALFEDPLPGIFSLKRRDGQAISDHRVGGGLVHTAEQSFDLSLHVMSQILTRNR